MLVPDCAGQEAWWEPSTCRAGDAAGHSTCRAGDGPGVARVAVPIQPLVAHTAHGSGCKRIRFDACNDGRETAFEHIPR